MQGYGATPAEWAQFDLILGLGEDLLPVVSNPKAAISPMSKMKATGKTPSVYNKARQVAGLPNWTTLRSTPADIAKWSGEPDYGICLQTRLVRALDIDVEDADKAGAIADFIDHWLTQHLPFRRRGNSGKMLLAFRLAGQFAKRVLKVDGGIVEFLADGQQFVAVGTHPSGARYEWVGGLPDEFPELTLEEFEALWAALVAEFGIEEQRGGALRKRGEDLGLEDDVVDQLDVLSWGRDGQAFITCPFKDGHSMDSGETETAYFPAGTGGYQQGHFKCLHASCAGRSDAEFLSALGLGVENDFKALPDVAPERELPMLERDKTGRILATLENLESVLLRADVCGEYIAFDEFRDEVMYAPWGQEGQWRSFYDDDYTRLRIHLARNGFRPISREMMRDVVHRVVRLKRFDSAIEWLKGLKWDGTPRVAGFLSRYFGATDVAYTRAVSEYLWTALAGRVLAPGVKADMVPVLIGQQGVGKTYGVSSLVPSADHVESINLVERDADLARRMRGKLVIEIGELRGLHSRDMETIKEFITRTHESWVPKYQEFAQKYPRRCVFIGTTNQEEFLADPTGNRRWLPVRCGVVCVKDIVRDRLQLWAEAREMFDLLGGVSWRDAQRLAEAVHDEHRMTDTWEEEITEWLDRPDSMDGTTPASKGYVLVNEVLRGAFGMDLKNVRRGDEMRVASILREKGYVRKVLRVGKKLHKAWEAPR